MGQNKFKILKGHFADKKLVRFIATTRHCKLTLKERWVYSALLWRFKNHPVTKNRIARWTGVDRTRTLPRVLVRLANLRLVVKDGQKFKAVQPPEDLMPWFATWDNGKEDERLVISNNWAVYDLDRDIIDNLVACDDVLGYHKAAKLARRYGVCGKTITAARRRLASQPIAASPTPTQPVAEPQRSATPVATNRPEEQPADPAQQFVDQLARYHCLETDATKEIARLCRLLRGLARKEIGQIVGALVSKFGRGEGLEDAVYHLIQTHYLTYFRGATLERVMADIGMGCPSDDDDLSLTGTEFEEEIAV